MKICILILASSYLLASTIAQGGECPNGWEKLQDEKCYLLVSTYTPFAGAKAACAEQDGTLALIKEQKEQVFLTNFIYNYSSVELGVWIGATRVSELDFQWNDGTNLDFSNWDVDHPSSIPGRDCVAMQSRLSKQKNNVILVEDGKWRDVSCNIANYFVCETIQTWSFDDVKKVLIETRKSLQSTIEDLAGTKLKLSQTEDKLLAETKKVENLQNNPVPIGFIYYEHHGQPAPQILWPGVTWKDVTSTYAGLFFRALGGGSADFGATQEGDSPRLTQAAYSKSDKINAASITISPGDWSPWLHITYDFVYYKDMYQNLRFFVTNPEVRPNNAAVRIWRREA